MKKENIMPKIGDFVVTNINFWIDDGKKLKSMENFYGIIVHIKEEKVGEETIKKYGIKFGEVVWGEDLDGILSDNTGYYLTDEEFDLSE